MARLPRLPDLLTTANLACGVGSILLASQGQLTWACWLVFAGAIFDVFDGLAARALGQGGSEFGKQLDSLADVVTFGVAPGVILFFFPYTSSETLLVGGGSFYMSDIHIMGMSGSLPSKHSTLTWFAALLIPLCSAWRLGKFNTDTRQTTGFLGLPTPANGLFWASLPLGFFAAMSKPSPIDPESFMKTLPFALDPLVHLAVAVILGALMLSEIPLPSLKFKHFHWQGNEIIYILAVSGLVLVLLYGILAIPLILLLYLLSPLWGKLFPRQTPKSPGSTGSP